MDKLAVISGTLFLAANFFAITSLVLPDWIVTEVGGKTRLGLFTSCITIYNRETICHESSIKPEWLMTVVFIVVGCIFISSSALLLILSTWNRRFVRYAKWMGFWAVIVLCLAAVIFPAGFSHAEIGGAAYQLPKSHQVGISYILFVMALWTTVISELFASKVCLPATI